MSHKIVLFIIISASVTFGQVRDLQRQVIQQNKVISAFNKENSLLKVKIKLLEEALVKQENFHRTHCEMQRKNLDTLLMNIDSNLMDTVWIDAVRNRVLLLLRERG